MKRKAFSIYQVNSYIKSLIESDVILNDIYVEAEISNFKLHSSGHMYFTLKDDKASINCVMFKSQANLVPFIPENGMKILASGYVSLYEKTGQYQLYIKNIEPSGKGSLYVAFEQLKEKLFNEGLFDDIHKKPIPKYPTTIGIITSPTGAGVQDIISVCKRRNKNINLVLYPVLVQGENASTSICKAIESFNIWNGCDVIILGRGGGSIEDLWAFNEENVAYSIFKSKIPIISAVGHEIDFTISDFVADVRATTPSVGAELAVPNLYDLNKDIENLTKDLNLLITNKIRTNKQKLVMLSKSISISSFIDIVEHNKNILNRLNLQLINSIMFKINSNREILKNKVILLESVSPLSILKKGFAIVEDDEGNIIKNQFDISQKQLITVKFNDGSITAEVRGINNG